MVDPISNQQFSHDYQKFVFQELSSIPVGPYGTPKPLFSIPSAKKTKKDIEKEKNKGPFGLIKRKEEEDQSPHDDKKDKKDKKGEKGTKNENST